MNPKKSRSCIEAACPAPSALVSSGDNVHFEAVVIARGVRRQARRCSATSWSTRPWAAAMGNEIHALALQVFTPGGVRGQGRG